MFARVAIRKNNLHQAGALVLEGPSLDLFLILSSSAMLYCVSGYFVCRQFIGASDLNES